VFRHSANPPQIINPQSAGFSSTESLVITHSEIKALLMALGPANPAPPRLLGRMVKPRREFALWYQLEPISHYAMNLKIHVLMHPDMTAALTTESRAGVRDAITAVHIEDIAANEGPWKALHAPLTQ
jgi:hypothetical protein